MSFRRYGLKTVFRAMATVAVGATLIFGDAARGDDTPPSDWPRTRAESSDYQETSGHADVWRFLHDLKARGAPFLVASMGRSTEGREIPLVVAARERVTTPAEARRAGRPIVYVQANIHAGEVEGKEAALMLLRDVAKGEADPLLEKLVLLVAPIYNSDGNDAWGPGERHRPGQNGPPRVGRRSNGMGLDLNRDCMKAESPEMRAALARVYTTWEPDVVLDLHTTNGTRHGYRLTYSPPLAPDTEPGVLAFCRDKLLPEVRRRLRENYALEVFDYGNLSPRDAPDGWRTFEPHPRFVTNYVGLRNRVAVLSEATSYRPFRERVETTHRFVRAVLDLVVENADEVVELTREADRRAAEWGSDPSSAPPMGVRFDYESRGQEELLLEESRPDGETVVKREVYEIYDRFVATRTARLPAAYLIPARFPETVALLLRHGIVVERLEAPWEGETEIFRVHELNTSPRPFQGHRLHRVDGTFEKSAGEFPAGTVVVRTAQPLAVLIFHLLEPESPDGVAAWGFLDRALGANRPYPIQKCFGPVHAPAIRVENRSR